MFEFLLLLVLFLIGYGLSCIVFEKATLFERFSTTAFLMLAVPGFFSIHYSLVFRFLQSESLTWIIAFSLLAIVFCVMIWKYRDRTVHVLLGCECLNFISDGLTFLCFIAAVVVYALFYSNMQAIVSLGSYIMKGDAECFYMQSFKTLNVLNPILNRYNLPHEFYTIICTPGNTLFTVFMLPVFKLATFFYCYLLFAFILVVCVYLLVNETIKNRLIALCVALFSLLNPYMTSIEILDRNVMSFALSALLLFSLKRWKTSYLLHGFVFGLLAGTGLRFLPLLFGIPLIVSYIHNKARWNAYLFCVTAFVLTFAFNLPHLKNHGLHSLGEEMGFVELCIAMFTEWFRTPFAPFPNLIWYGMNIISFCGVMVAIFIVYGFCVMFKKNRTECLSLGSVFFLVVLVLSVQRDWIHGDKYRIILEAFAPMMIFMAYGIQSIFMQRYTVRKCLILIAAILSPFAFTASLSAVNFPMDTSFYERHSLYQKETSPYYYLIRAALSDHSIMPNYKRNNFKYDVARKKKEELLALKKLFSKHSLMNTHLFERFYHDWSDVLWPREEVKPIQAVLQFVNIKIDFNSLVTYPERAVAVLDNVELFSIDLSSPKELFDVYFSNFTVAWQNNDLPVCVLIDRDQFELLNELYLECNAFKAYGKDNVGLDIVNPIYSDSFIERNPVIRSRGMTTFPLYEENGSIFLRLPLYSKVVIRNWFVDGQNGTPYKVDAWVIDVKSPDRVSVEFVFNEPESYL